MQCESRRERGMGTKLFARDPYKKIGDPWQRAKFACTPRKWPFRGETDDWGVERGRRGPLAEDKIGEREEEREIPKLVRRRNCT